MTLIACVIPKNAKYPILIGDVLLSAEVGSSASITTHSQDILEMLLPKDQSFKPVDLSQKIYIINKNLCVAVAGYASELKSFLQDFRIYASYSPPTNENISKYVNDPERQALVPNSVVMILYSHNINDRSIRFSIDFLYGDKISPNERLEIEQIGTIFSEGSGKSTFDNLINYMTDAGHQNQNFNALLNSVRVAAACIGAEKMLPSHTLKDYWGAGYEIIFYEEGFQYLENIAYVICRGKYDEDGDIHFPKPDFIQFQRYFKGRLLSYAIDIFSGFADEEGESQRYYSKPGEFQVTIWEIPSLDNSEGSIISADLSTSFFTTSVGICYPIWTNENTYTFVNAAFHTQHTSVKFDGHALEILVHKSIIDQTRASAKKFYDEL